MTPDLLLAHYHEIGLKGRNRPRFERALKDNLKRALADSASRVRLVSGRVEIHGPKPDALERVTRVFGVANVAPVLVTQADLDQIVSTALEVAGDAVRLRLGKRVNLSDPDVCVRIEIVHDRAYVSAAKIPGPGGLPVGSAGPVVTLLSAGIDSPVATWRIMRRGADPVAVHFHGQPFTDRSSERKVGQLVSVLGTWGYRRPWWSVPMGEAQREITLSAPSPLRVLLYRRLMLRVAEGLGRRHGGLAVVTGESLGQVASQTLENMAAVGAVATLPLLRPLVGTDKVEIIDEARRIGTYEVSAEAHQDCCTLFEPREPATHATAAELDAAETGYDLPALVDDCLARAQRQPAPG